MATRKKVTRLTRAKRGTIRGFNSLRRNIKKYGEQMGAALQEIAVATGLRVKESATDKLMTGEGRAPDPITFELARSVVMVVMKTRVRVGTAVMHGFYQEFGTAQHKAHPWLFPSLREQRSYYEGRLRELHAKAMKGLVPGDD